MNRAEKVQPLLPDSGATRNCVRVQRGEFSNKILLDPSRLDKLFTLDILLKAGDLVLPHKVGKSLTSGLHHSLQVFDGFYMFAYLRAQPLNLVGLFPCFAVSLKRIFSAS